MPISLLLHLSVIFINSWIYMICIFRNIKGFMIQGGDPTGTGKGGESIYGTKLRDEFSPELRYDTTTYATHMCAYAQVPFLYLQITIALRCVATPKARQTRYPIDGEQWARYSGRAVLLHLRTAASPQQPIHHYRKVGSIITF